MSQLAVKLYVTATLINILSCVSMGYADSSKTNDNIVFEPEPYRDTGFDVGFIGVASDKSSERPESLGFDTGFDGSRPGFASGHSGNRPSVSQGNEGSHVINPEHGTAQNHEIGENRPGFATSRPDGGFIGIGDSNSGYDSARPAIASSPSEQYPSRPGFATGHRGFIPHFVERNLRQLRPGFPYNFDTGFDGTRPEFFQRYPRGSARPGFSQGNENKFDVGFDGTRPGFAQGNQNEFDPGFDGTRPGFAQGNQPFDAGFDGMRPGFAQRYPRDVTETRIKRQAFDIGFDGTRPGFVQNTRPKLDAGFDGTRPGFSQKVSPNFDAGFDGTRFSQRYPRGFAATSPAASSEFVENELVQNDNKQLGQSEKFLLQPHYIKSGGPFPVWNNQPMTPYPTYFNNMGPYGPGPGGMPQGGFGPGGYWQ